MGGANGRVNQAEKEKVNNKNSRGRVSLNGGASAGARSEAVQRGRVRTDVHTIGGKKKKISDFIKPNDIIRIKGGVDRPLLVIVIILLCFGTIMVFSASYAYALSDKGDSFYYIKKQLLFAAIGLTAMIFAMRFDYRWLRKLTIPIFLVTMGLLAVVLLYGISSGSAKRWILIGGFTLQPSEIMKFALVLMLSLYIARNQNRITDSRSFMQRSKYGIFIPLIIVFVVCVMIALEKHYSCTIIMFLIGMVVIFAGGAPKFWFMLAGAGGLAGALVAILFSGYARERLDTFLHPEKYSITDELWQSTQGLNAVGSGGFLGVGLGNSTQKHMFVSEPQNDFIFSIICEELGFVGAMAVIILFAILIWRGFVIALKAPDTFSSLVVIGITAKVAIQAILNIAVVTGTIPNTGISLPFFSYGGTALIMQLGEMGIVLSISRYSYQQK